MEKPRFKGLEETTFPKERIIAGLSWKLAIRDPNILIFFYKASTHNFAKMCTSLVLYHTDLLSTAMFSNTYMHMGASKHTRLPVPLIKDPLLQGQLMNFFRPLESTSKSMNLNRV